MERKKRIFRHLKTLEEAKGLFLGRFAGRLTQPETIPVRDALDRVAAGSVRAAASSPAYHAAAMDGIAVRAADTFGALPEKPVLIPRASTARMVDTGDPMPDGTDAVVMIEKVEEAGEAWEVRESAYPWQNVRKTGEDIVRGEIIIPSRRRIRPYDQGAMLAAGLLEVEVLRRPRVAVIPTGDEIVIPEDAPSPLPPGVLLEVNGAILASMCAECGADAEVLRPVPDKPELLEAAIREALAGNNDLVMIIAGSSAGSEDFTPALIEKIGEILVHGVTVMPGKPALLGAAAEKPVVGIPGYPVSAIVAFREFVRPLLFMLQGLHPPAPDTVTAAAGRKIPSKLGLEEHVRVILGRPAGRIVAMPLGGGAGVITSMVRADGILKIPQESTGVAEGEEVRVESLIPSDAIDDNLLAIGSHDLTIDLLGGMLKERTGGRFRISSSNVGSLGGLFAIRKKTAHMAGSHLLDEETGGYNVSYLREHLPDTPVALLTLVHRWQGFMTAPGNPKKILGVADLARPDVVFVNRQAGSGTRILLDYELRCAGIDAASIQGYRNEEYTHMSVAVAVVSGAADTGLGIHAAARALSLDFVPVTRERYDLVIPREIIDDEKIRILLEVIRSDEFKSKVLELGGYEVGETGIFVDL